MGNRTRLIVLFAGLIIILAFAGLQFYFSNTKKNCHKETEVTGSVEKVGRGEVILSVKTSGVVEPDKDILLRSPQRSIIKRVAVNAGSKVKKGDLLFELEAKDVKQEIDRINQQLGIKQNALEKYKLNKENTLLSLKQGEDGKRNRLASLKTSLMQQEKALKVGGIDSASVERTRNEIDLAEKDLQNMVDKNAIRLKQMETDEKGLLIQINAQKQDLEAKQKLIQNFKITAPKAGVILEIPAQKGERVESEQMLVRMTDLSAFKIVGWANIKQIDLVATGDSAIVELNGLEMHGTVGKITQMYDDQMFRFDVHLDKNHQEGLIINTSVVVEVISKRRENVLKIKKQPGLENTTHQTVYLIKGEEKIKTELIIGVIGNEWCEVVSGLKEGDEIMSSEIMPENIPQSVSPE